MQGRVSSRTGRVVSGTTSHTTTPMTPSSTAWRHSVAGSTWRASVLRGLCSWFPGLAMGLDQITAQLRYTGGIPELMGGLEAVRVAVGLFAVGETLHLALYEGRSQPQLNRHRLPLWPTDRRLSRHKDEFGTVGPIEGVAGPEAANNAAVTATLVPPLTLGIRTSVTAASGACSCSARCR